MQQDFSKYYCAWNCLSELYLDTQHSKDQILHFIETLKSTEFSLAELKHINKTHVFPVLHYNLISTAGVWNGFDEDWLKKTIIEHIKSNNFIKKTWVSLLYKLHSRYFGKFWNLVQKNW